MAGQSRVTGLHWAFGAALIGALAVGAWLRVPTLADRPMHGDEANQAIKTGILLERGDYRYDPEEHHGPTLYYAAFAVLRMAGVTQLAGASEAQLRTVPLLFGLALIVLCGGAATGMGKGAATIAALLTALSPAMVFYSQYFIQEMALVFFTLLVLCAGWRYVQSPGWGWAILTGTGIGLMHATKETCIIAFAAMGLALVLTWLLQGRPLAHGVMSRHVAAGFAAAVVVSIVFYSSFFTNLRGPLDSILTYGNYLTKGTAPSVHDHPWYWYLALLGYTKRAPGPWWSEGLILGLALVGLAAALVGSKRLGGHIAFLRFIALYAVAVTAAYSIIPYKTPWTVLTALSVLILLAGVGATYLLRVVRFRLLQAAVLVLVAAGCLHLGKQATAATTTYRADVRNPYVYAHTSTALLRMVALIERVADGHPAGKDLRIAVVRPSRDYWPIPWYLRGYGQVGYFDALPEDVAWDLVITGPDVQLAGYVPSTSGLRPGVLIVLHVRQDWWDAIILGKGASEAPGA